MEKRPIKIHPAFVLMYAEKDNTVQREAADKWRRVTTDRPSKSG